MVRSISVLMVILISDIVLTGIILKRPVQIESETSRIDVDRIMSLSPYRYSQDFGIASNTYPEYSVDDFLARGREFRRVGQSRRAEDIFKTALLFDGDNPETVKAIGEIAFLDGRYQEACNYFTQYLSLRPNSLEAHTNLSISFLSVDNLMTATMLAEKGLEKFADTNPGPFFFILASIKQKEGDIVASEEYLRKACQALNTEILKLVNAIWSASIKELPSYEAIIVDCLEKSRDSDDSDAADTASGIQP